MPSSFPFPSQVCCRSFIYVNYGLGKEFDVLLLLPGDIYSVNFLIWAGSTAFVDAGKLLSRLVWSRTRGEERSDRPTGPRYRD